MVQKEEGRIWTLATCDDGTMWYATGTLSDKTDWKQVANIPESTIDPIPLNIQHA